MFSIIKHVFFVLLKFSSSLASVAKASDQRKCVSLKDEPCIIKPTLIDLNPVQLKYCLFMISLGKYNGSCIALCLVML